MLSMSPYSYSEPISRRGISVSFNYDPCRLSPGHRVSLRRVLLFSAHI